MDLRWRQAHDVNVKSENESGTAVNCSEHDAGQAIVQEKVLTTWLFDTAADTHVMPKCVWEQMGEPALQTTNITLRGANGQDLGVMGEVQVRGFIGKIKVHFRAVMARDARRCLLSGIQLRKVPSHSRKVVKRCKGHVKETGDTQWVTSLMLKRELESVRRELRNLKTGKHENTRENVEGEMTADERITHERAGHATYDPRC